MRCRLPWAWLVALGACVTAAHIGNGCPSSSASDASLLLDSTSVHGCSPTAAGSSLVQLTSRTHQAGQQQEDSTAMAELELGPAASGLSMLEVMLESSSSHLEGPGSENQSTLHGLLFFGLVFLFVSMFVMAVPFVGLGADANVSGHVIGNSIKAYLHKMDVSILGVHVEIGHLTVNPFDGYVDCEHLIVHNPPGYSSPHLLKADKVLLDIDMEKLVLSRMNKISVEKLVFRDMTAIYEKKWTTSNVQEVLDHLAKKELIKKDEVALTTAARDAAHAKADLFRQPSKMLSEMQKKREEAAKNASKVEVHRVEVQNTSVNIRPSGNVGEYVSFNVEAGNIHYKDFHTEVGHAVADDIAQELLKAILKTVISNVAGQHAAHILM